MYLITKTFKFEAAHRLEDWPIGHQCNRLHGHSYQFTITLIGDILSGPPKPGVILDYGDLSTIVIEEIVFKWDHEYLNEVLNERNVTAEFLAKKIHDILRPYLPIIHSVEVKETATSSAVYIP